MITWSVYLLRCADNSLYCGISTNLDRRVNEHNYSKSKGAKYTKARRPVKLVYFEVVESRSHASQREYQLRQLTKHQKEALITAFHALHTLPSSVINE